MSPIAALLRASLLPALILSSPALAEAPPILSPADYAPAVTRQDILPGIYEMAYAPDLDALFVASATDLKPEGGGAVTMLDATDLRVLRRTGLSRAGFALAYDHNRQRLYAGNTIDGSVTVIDAPSGVVTALWQLGLPDSEGRAEHIRMLEVAPDGSQLFVSSPGEKGIVWVLDPAAGKILHRIEDTGLWSAGLGFDQTAGRVYASGGGMEEIAAIDPVSGTRIGGLTTGDATVPGREGSKHFLVNLTIDTARQRLYAADAGSGEVIAFDIATGTDIARIASGQGLLDVLYNPARDEIYASYRGVGEGDTDGTGGLSVIDAASLSVKAQMEIPVHPNSLTLGKDGKILYLSVKMPLDQKHKAFREGAADSILRIDLERLEALLPG